MNVNDLLACFQFIGSSIKRLHIDNDFISFSGDGITKNIDVDFEIGDVWMPPEGGEEKDMIGTILLSVNVFASEESRHLEIDLLLQGCFTSPITEKKDDQAIFREMLKLNGTMALYSIARSIIMTVAPQAFVSGDLILPMMNIVAFKEAKEAAESKKTGEQTENGEEQNICTE